MKADGLAAGKGVLVTDDREAALAHADALPAAGPGARRGVPRRPGGLAVLPRATATTCCRSAPRRTTSASRRRRRPEHRRHGRLLAAAVARRAASAASAAFVDEVIETIAVPTVRQLDAEGTPFIGLLYCRPHPHRARHPGHRVQRALRRPRDPGRAAAPRRPRCRGCCSPPRPAGSADCRGPTFADEAAVTVVLASEGYPEAPDDRPRASSGLDAAASVAGRAHRPRRDRDRPSGDGTRRRHRRPRAQRRRRSATTSPRRARRAYEALGAHRASRAASTAPTSPRASPNRRARGIRS